MDDRHLGDYEVRGVISADDARRDLEDAQRFVERVDAYLREKKWL
jgi:hypothetical protein